MGAAAARPFAPGLLKLLGSGSFAGFAFGASDVFRASLAVPGWLGVSSAAALLGLWLWFGQLLAVVFWAAGLVAAVIKARLPNRAAWHVLLTFLAGAVTLLLARKMFSGGGIRRTHVGNWGPWVLPLCVVLGAWVTARLVVRGWARITRWAFIGAAAVLSLAAGVLDSWAPGDYLYLHVLLLALGLALATKAVDLMRLPAIAKRGALAASLLTLPSLVAFPSSRPARELLAQPTWAGLQLIDYAQFHVDFDHDGHSPLFGGGDCNDTNASVFVGAPERPGDGQDSDCDGLDDPRVSTLSFKPFHAEADLAARQTAERARHYPTVVILVDALRFDRIGKPRFPNLAQLAQESIRFSHVYATSATTLTSVPAMMSGLARPGTGRDNIAQSLARAGQSSCVIAPDAIVEHFQQLGLRDPLLSFSSHETIPTDHAAGWGVGDTVSTSDQITAAAIDRLDSAQPPDLLWLHYFDVHQWDALEGPGLPGRGDASLYDAVLERMDASLRPLLERRDRVNLVLLADHGEALGVRGVRHHANFMFQELTHIPLLIRMPGSAPATVDTPVSSTGIFNTLRALRGLEPDATADGSLLALVGAKDVGEGPGFEGFDRAQWSFLYGQHRLLYMPQRQLVELYDVAQDPFEHKNQAEENPRLASELLARLFQLRNEAP